MSKSIEKVSVAEGAKEERKKREDKLASIEKRAIKLYKAISVLEDLASSMGDKDSSKKAVNDCVEILNQQLLALENISAQMVKAKFAELKHLYKG